MADEVQSVRRRISTLEDALLDLLQEAETTGSTQAGLERQRDGQAVEIERTTGALAAGESELDAEEDELAPRRAALAGEVPADLLRTYDRLRAHLDGVAVAPLDGTRCSGCHLTLPATELDALRHAAPGTVVRHEECGRILVPPS
jgi:predicted  nucleic acid-binding Zn-ribbon protein